MNEVLQDSSKTGTALKSISANMSGVIFGLKEGDVQANKTAKALESLTGIKLFDEQTGEVMDMYEAMEQLNGKWDGLTEAQRSSIAQTIAGKQNLQSFLALMDNWDTARQYVDDYNKSVGEGNEILRNATDENEQYLDSVQGKWNSIKEDLKATGLNIIDSEMAKDGLDFISSITSVLPKASEKANEFYSTLMGGNFAEEMSDKFYEAFEKIDGKLKGFSSKISDFITNTFGDNKITNAISDMFKGLSESNFLNKWMTDVSTLYGKSMDAITNLIPGISSLKGVGEILNIDSEKKQLEDSIDGHKNRIDILQSEIGSMTEQQKKLNGVSEEYEKLSRNTKRSAEEEEKYLNLKNEIASANPDLVLGYDSSGSPILKDLKLQNEQYDRQIKLKQQSLRLEENALATDTQKQRLQNLEDYNKALEKYNNSQLYSDTKRKDGFFTDESLQDYAKRLKESNADVEKANLESYSKRLEDHQKYLDDERAIQEKYINQMESSNSFEKMSESARQNMLTFMDTLNWSEFSDAQASSFARQLEEVSDKIVSTTDQMGEYGKKINEVSDAYANHESNMIGYTKALGDIYEASGKLDNQSLMQWYDSLKQYGSLTGDLNGVNACINEMATSLEKVTGIDASTWKTAFEFDRAPIDASSKALQNFLKAYNTGVQNLDKGGLADKLKSQFETLQSSYLQLTEDVANGGTIDAEYLLNMKINQPEPIQNLIDEIISDNEVTEQEIELLMTVMPEILNTGEISEATLEQIADVLGMDVQEVKAKLKVNAEVEGNFEEVQKIENLKDKTIELTTKVKDFNLVEKAKEIWEGLKDKAIELKTKIKDFNLMEQLGNLKDKAIELTAKIKDFDLMEKLGNLKDKAIELAVKIIGQENIEKIQETLGNFKNSVVELTVKILGQDNIDKLQEAWGNFKENLSELKAKIEVEGQEKIEKIQEAWNTFKENFNEIKAKVEVEGQEKIEKIQEAWNTFKETVNEIKINIQNTELVQNLLEDLETLKEFKDGVIELAIEVKDDYLTTISKALESFKNKTIELAIEVKDEYLGKVKELWDGFIDKNVNLVCAVLNGELVEYLKEDWENLKDKAINLAASVTGSELVQTLKNLWDKIKSKAETLTASVTGTNLVQTLKGLWDGIKSKVETLKASTSGTNLVQTLKNAWQAIKTKSVKLSASVSGSGAVTSLKSAWASIKSKTVTLTAKVSQIGSSISSGLKNLFGGRRSIDVPIQANPTVVTSRKVQPINTTNLSDIPINASDTPTSTDISLANIGVSAKASTRSSILENVKYGVESYKELEQALEKIASQFDIIDKKAEQAFSLDKVELLNKQIDLMKQQQELQHGIANEEREQLPILKSQLQSKGFLINADNEILNYEEKLLALEKNVEALREKSNNSKDDEGLKKQYENANEELELTKKYLSEFINSNKQLSNASAEWWELSNSIQEAKEEIYDILNQNIETEIDDIADSIDFLSSKIDNLNGQEKIKYIQQQNALYKQQQQLLHQLAEQMRYQLTLLDPMSDKYKELSSEISNLSAEWWELQNSIQNNQMEVFEEQTRGTRNEIDELSDTIDFLDAKIENLYGQEKINYINQQNEAYREQQQVLHILAEQLRAQRSQLDPLSEEYADLSSEISDLSTEWWELQEALKDNQMEIFEEQNRGIKNHINELSDSIDFLDEKIENMNGTEKIGYIEEQNALYKRQQEVLHILAEQMRAQLALLDPLSQEYADLSSEIKGLSTEWWELENAMKDNMFEIFEEQTEGVRNRIDDITNSIDFLDAKMDNYSGEEKIAIIEEQNALYEQQQNALHELIELLRSQLATLDPMSDEYQDMENDISDLSTEWWELEKAISSNLDAIEEVHEEHREALRDQLDATKDIEEKITKVYEKEYEKRKKELEDYYDKRTKLLNEEKEAYREMRDEQEYEKGLQDQTDEIGELRKKLEIAKRDNSIEGLKRQKELAEELAEAEGNLAKYTQDKIDSDYEKNIDNEIDRLEEEKTTLLGALEEQFSEINIAKLVQSALSSGFVEINGEVKSLQDLLIESINDTTDAYSVMGATIKQEMVDNLSIALDTMKELESIYKDLNIKDFGLIPSNMSSLSPSNNYNTNTRSITVGETNITINGSVSNDILNDIEDLIEQKNNEMLKSISKGL